MYHQQSFRQKYVVFTYLFSKYSFYKSTSYLHLFLVNTVLQIDEDEKMKNGNVFFF
jgi:hypothetical protein